MSLPFSISVTAAFSTNTLFSFVEILSLQPRVRVVEALSRRSRPPVTLHIARWRSWSIGAPAAARNSASLVLQPATYMARLRVIELINAELVGSELTSLLLAELWSTISGSLRNIAPSTTAIQHSRIMHQHRGRGIAHRRADNFGLPFPNGNLENQCIEIRRVGHAGATVINALSIADVLYP